MMLLELTTRQQREFPKLLLKTIYEIFARKIGEAEDDDEQYQLLLEAFSQITLADIYLSVGDILPEEYDTYQAIKNRRELDK